MAILPPVGYLSNGRFVLVQHLGGGGFGDVYEAFDRGEDRPVAIKVPKPTVRIDDVLLEGQLHIRLSDHRHIADIYHIGFDGPGAYFSLRLLRGGSARDRIAQGPVELTAVVEWVRAILTALQHAHDLGVLHRDLHVANILFDDAGAAYLTDFGISEDAVRKHSALAQYPPIASPEFLVGGHSSVQTEVWQMGCVLYKLLTGQDPFGPAPTRADLRDTGPRDTVQSLNPQVTMRLARVIRTALRIDPADRFQTAQDMLNALNACPVRCSWTRLAGPGESWTTEVGGSRYLLTLATRPRAGLELTLQRDAGSGLRRVHIARPADPRAGRDELARILRTVVENGRWP